ncbi:heavy metal transport/detoxification protein [Gonapodya prolifera JEL478]|uniref:Heavy metal transport/detoxification protein n=1 Tax=Gonapodya prolifera (strain JEL478) TaxID=1344416 RepID=A0A139AXY5_GONPJ|nr:heavy metal transport/detoxification protein [Gonapodya prolifera JEL478]|eukprot:KXS21612.1 heavy metal transport/detoxification protein [Gonapodya prolifera JEL478]
MADQTYSFKVGMSCNGCVNAVNKALSRTEGVSKVDISLENQLVNVTASIPKDAVFEAIKKTGKPVENL